MAERRESKMVDQKVSNSALKMEYYSVESKGSVTEIQMEYLKALLTAMCSVVAKEAESVRKTVAWMAWSKSAT